MWPKMTGIVLALTPFLLASTWAQNPAGTPADEAVATFESGEYGAAFQAFTRAADGGDPKAMYWIGWFYEQGWNGDAEAFRRMMDGGESLWPDRAEAVRWWIKSARLGNPDAQYQLGTYYELGVFFPRDRREAFRWICAAARQGHADAAVSVRHGFPEPWSCE